MKWWKIAEIVITIGTFVINMFKKKEETKEAETKDEIRED